MNKIEWCDETWNPIVGCSKISAGCKNCYAQWMAKKQVEITLKRIGSRGRYGSTVYAKTSPLGNGEGFPSGKFRKSEWTGEVDTTNDLNKPRTWRKPKRIFTCSMSDLFHDAVPTHWINHVFFVMRNCPQHTFLLLTKRARRMHTYLTEHAPEGWPFPNVHVGVTAENQETAYERIPILMNTPAAVRFVSYEPALGPVDWYPFLGCDEPHEIHGLICGGESGPGARPMNPEWARAVRDACLEHGVAFMFKQWGVWGSYERLLIEDVSKKTHYWSGNIENPWSICVGKKAAGRELDGRTWDDVA